MSARNDWPTCPPVEDDLLLEAHLDRIDANGPTRAFCYELARDGVSRIDLGDEARVLCDHVVAEMENRFAADGVNRIQDAWLRSKMVRQLATFPKVEALLRAAYGRPPFAFQTLNFRVGTEQPVHADAISFHSVPERFMCGVWIALEDIYPTSGPLTYYAGSHKLPVLTMSSAGVNHPDPTYEDYKATYLPALLRTLEVSGLNKLEATPRKGEALVWTANLAHGGAPIVDMAATRRSLVTHFFFKDCFYYTPMTSNMALGRLSTRLPTNISSGGVEWPRLNGKPVRVNRHQIIDAVRKLVFRRVSTF